jgi:hypothetical protein
MIPSAGMICHGNGIIYDSPLIFLEYISDAFPERHDWLETADPKSDYYVHYARARYEVAERRCIDSRPATL